MKRALRPDKLTLAFLEQTLKLYDDPETLAENLPLLATMTTPLEILSERATRLQNVLTNLLPDFKVSVTESDCQIGSGSLPDRRLPSVAVTLHHAQENRVRALHEALRRLPKPIIGRIREGQVWLDMRGASRLDALMEALSGLKSENAS